jgi:exonuclease III
MLKTLISFFFLLLLTSPVRAFTPICRDFFLPPVPKQQLQDIKKLNIGSYNVLNLNHSVGKYQDINGQRVFVPDSKAKPEWQQREVANAIKETNLDILVLQEVEGINALEDFASNHLDDLYYPIVMKGNDGRGIEIGFLVKKNLPFEINMQSYKEMTWQDPLSGNQTEKLFSRDLPVMNIYFSNAQPRGPPDMVLIGTHYKSQRGSGSDPTSKVMREAQVKETARIIQQLKDKHGPKTPILLAGDFNADINSSEFSHLKEGGMLHEALDAKNVDPKERVTHSYHPRDGETKYSQLDAIMFTPDFTQYVEEAGVYRYKDANGNVKPIPRTYEERELNPSDHFMTWMKVDFSSFLNR